MRRIFLRTDKAMKRSPISHFVRSKNIEADLYFHSFFNHITSGDVLVLSIMLNTMASSRDAAALGRQSAVSVRPPAPGVRRDC